MFKPCVMCCCPNGESIFTLGLQQSQHWREMVLLWLALNSLNMRTFSRSSAQSCARAFLDKCQPHVWRTVTDEAFRNCCLKWLQGNSFRLLSPDLVSRSNETCPKYSTTPRIPQVFSSEGLAGRGGEGRGGDSFRVWEGGGRCAAAALALPVEVGLVQSSDIILPVLVLSPPQPTGGFVSLRSCQTALHPRPLPSPFLSCVTSSYLLRTCSSLSAPVPWWHELWKQSVVSDSLSESCVVNMLCLWKVGSPHPCFLLHSGQSQRLPQGLREARTKRGATLSLRRSSRPVYKSYSQVSFNLVIIEKHWSCKFNGLHHHLQTCHSLKHQHVCLNLSGFSA